MMATANCHHYFAAARQRLQLPQLPSITCSAGVLRRKPALGKLGGGGGVRYCLGGDPKTPVVALLARAGGDIWAGRGTREPQDMTARVERPGILRRRVQTSETHVKRCGIGDAAGNLLPLGETPSPHAGVTRHGGSGAAGP